MPFSVKAENLVFAHEPDAAWIIALYKHIHGGDPAPEAVAAQVIAALAPYAAQPAALSAQAMTQTVEKQFANLGVRVNAPQTEELSIQPPPIQPRPRQYCFEFQGRTICVTLPPLRYM